MSRNRILTIALVLGLVVLVAAGSWIAGSRIMSPAEAAARTAPPTPSPILVPVEQRVLSSDVVTRGTAHFGVPLSLSIVPSSLKADSGIVTSLPAQNMQLQEGDVVLTVSGRPVFILQGDVPAFRDLVPGLSGTDVRQLEEALRRLGFDPGMVDGVYDEQTSAAVAAWYTAGRWEPFSATDQQLAHIRELEHALAVAINDQQAAEDSLAAAPLGITAARANANAANLYAASNANAKTTTRDTVMANTNSTSEDRANANADLEAATAAVNAAQLEGEVTIQAAVDALKAAQRTADTATNLVNQITADLDAAHRENGVQVPADEIVFLPRVPVRVDQVKVAIGDAGSGAIMTVTNNQLAIDSSLPLDEAALVKPGMAVTIDEPDLGITATGVVAQVADTPGTFGADGFHIYFEVLVNPTPVALDGFSLRMTIPVQSTGGPVTAVPVSALSLAADGTSRVQVENNGLLEFITVKPGLAADGFVEVNPIDGRLQPGQVVVIGFK